MLWGLEDDHKLVPAAVKLCCRIKHEVNFAGRIAWLKVTPLTMKVWIFGHD
jgi:hypothetical protein